MEIVRVYLSANNIDPPGTRYNPDCDCIQTSPDGGATWTDNPGADPRTNDAYRLPAREGSDPKCDAAEAMTQHFKAQVDAFIAAADAVAYVNAAIQIAGAFFGLIGLFASKLFIIFEALLTIGVITVDAAMTEEVYDQIKCILYCQLEENGQLSAEGLANAQTQIDEEIGGTPNIVFDLFAGAWGAVEWSNAGAVGEFTGDCDECGCGCNFVDVTSVSYGTITNTLDTEWHIVATFLDGFGYGCNIVPVNGGDCFKVTAIFNQTGDDISNTAYRDMNTNEIVFGNPINQCTNFVGLSSEISGSAFECDVTICECPC